MKARLQRMVRKLPYFKSIYTQLDALSTQLAALEVPPGHFYSPIPSLGEIKLREDAIFGYKPREISGIDLNEGYQLKLLTDFKIYYDEQPFFRHKQEGVRYYFENYLYPYSDAIFLYCMIRHFQPTRIIEVGGSGFSSCVILDTCDRFLENKLSCTCLEPYPENILALIDEEKEENFELIRKPVQDIDLSFFQSLSQNDILFIDSTHISKINSDVNYLIFQVIPSLQKGILIHFHDIFYPFEYPKEWIYNKRAWNEAYILRAFLQYNKEFHIEFFNTFLQSFHEDFFRTHMPLCMEGVEYEWNGHHTWTGGSLWLRKL